MKLFVRLKSSRQHHTEISETTVKQLMLFSTTQFCKNEFYTYVYIKNDYSDRIESGIRLSNIRF